MLYRDLKPNNIMIDRNKNLVLIVLIRMIDIDEISSNTNHTIFFDECYSAPEIILGKISYKSDIYSIGQIIYYIINERNPVSDKKI